MAGSRGPAGAQQWLAAIAVALLAFWAPREDSGFVLRLFSAALGVAGLLFASVGLDMAQDWLARSQKPKANPFDIQVRRIELPTAPPGGVFGAARNMDTLLKGFPLDEKSRVAASESGFMVTSGKERLRAKVLAGSAIGWESGSPLWVAKRDEWMEAVHAAPRAARVTALTWMGVTSLPAEEASPAPAPKEGDTVRIDGVEKKPALNGKHAVVVRDANDAGRIGVRAEGAKESILLSSTKLTTVSRFDGTGVSIPCLRSFRNELASNLSGLTAAEAVTSVIMPLTHSGSCSLARALGRKQAADEAGKPYTAPATIYVCYADSCRCAARGARALAPPPTRLAATPTRARSPSKRALTLQPPPTPAASRSCSMRSSATPPRRSARTRCTCGSTSSAPTSTHPPRRRCSGGRRASGRRSRRSASSG